MKPVWTEAELATLRRLAEAGVKHKAIARQLPGRSAAGVRNQLGRLGLSGRGGDRKRTNLTAVVDQSLADAVRRHCLSQGTALSVYISGLLRADLAATAPPSAT